MKGLLTLLFYLALNSTFSQTTTGKSYFERAIGDWKIKKVERVLKNGSIQTEVPKNDCEAKSHVWITKEFIMFDRVMINPFDECQELNLAGKNIYSKKGVNELIITTAEEVLLNFDAMGNIIVKMKFSESTDTYAGENYYGELIKK